MAPGDPSTEENDDSTLQQPLLAGSINGIQEMQGRQTRRRGGQGRSHPGSLPQKTEKNGEDATEDNSQGFGREEGVTGGDGRRGRGNGPSKGQTKSEFRRLTKKDTKVMNEILGYMVRQRARLLLASLAMAVAAAAQLIVPSILGSIVDNLSEKRDMHAFNLSVLVLLISVVVRSLAAGVRRYYFVTAGEQLVNSLKRDLFEGILVREVSFFDAEETGELINRITDDTTKLRSTMSTSLPSLLKSLVTVIGGIAYLFVLSWRLNLVMLATLPFLAIALRTYGRRVRKLGKDTQDVKAGGTKVAAESISNIRTVKAFVAEVETVERFRTSVDDAYEVRRKWAVSSAFFMALDGFLFGGGITLMCWYGGYLVIHDKLSTGTLTSFLFYTMTIAGEISGMTSLYGDLLGSLGSSERILELILEGVHPEGDWPLPTPTSFVELKSVSFSYPCRLDQTVLQDLSLTLSPGKTVALVGASGGGKSSVVALLMRFYDPVGGKVYWDGVDARTLHPYYIRSQIGLVSQEPVLFSSSIRDNIAYGWRPRGGAQKSSGKPSGGPYGGGGKGTAGNLEDELENGWAFDGDGGDAGEVTQADIERAAKLAHAHDFISQFPDGYDTLVGERGVRLSGGQKQRIAIARALISNPKIIVLDEATSALDAESEYHVQQALDELILQHKGKGGRQAMLVIGHRLSTVRDADEILCLDGGRVVESGTHPELVTRNGMYANLVSRQLLS